MSNLQNNWLSAQSSRRYPLDDNATGTGDDGIRLKDDVIVDMHLRWPESKGAYAFVGGITVTANIVTVVILAATTPDAATGFTPLASITLKQPASEYAFYSLNPLTDGVGGFIAFGDLREPFSIRFATPSQGLLSPKVARPYRVLPIPTLRKYNRVDGLAGIVKLLGGTDVQVTRQQRTVGGNTVEAIVLSLQQPTSTRNPLADYVGPCDHRPESNNCEKVGVQSVNGVQPDCNGNLSIDFRSLIAANYTDCGTDAAGVTLEQTFGISDVCPIRTATRFLGHDYCHGGSSLSIPGNGGGGGGGGGGDPNPPSNSNSQGSYACADLPFQDCFDGSSHESWVLQLGLARLVVSPRSSEDNCPTTVGCIEVTMGTTDLFGGVRLDIDDVPIWGDVYEVGAGSSLSCGEVISEALQLYDRSRRNVFVWEDCGTGSSLGKRVTTHVQLINSGATHNAGVVLNYRTVDPYTNPRVNYFLVQINRNANRVELLFYNGINFVMENSVVAPVPFSFTDWYEIQSTVTTVIGGTRIQVQIRNVTTPSWPQVSFQLVTNRWGSADGFYGIHTNLAVANFGFWRLEDA